MFNTKRVLAVGDAGCGKKYLLHTYALFANKGVPPDNCSLTHYVYKVKGRTMSLILESISDLEFDETLRFQKYQNCPDVILLCFAIDSPESLANIERKWIHEMKHFFPKVPIVLVGNKADVRKKPTSTFFQPIAIKKGQEMAEKLGAYSYAESSIENNSLMDVFLAAAGAMAERDALKEESP